MEFLQDYGLFLAEVVTIVVAIGVVITLIASQRQKTDSVGHIQVEKINDAIKSMSMTLKQAIYEPSQLKKGSDDALLERRVTANSVVGLTSVWLNVD